MGIFLILGALRISGFVLGGEESAPDAPDDGDAGGGASGDDLLRGGGMNDLLRGFGGDDVIDGGGGDHALFGGMGDDRLRGGAGADDLNAGPGDDVLFGGADADSLFGGFGRDLLSGGRPDRPDDGAIDHLDGEAGPDTLILGPADIGTGGAGADTFAIVDSAPREDITKITDFDTQADRLHLLPDDLDLRASQVIGRYTDAGLEVVNLRDGATLVLLAGLQPPDRQVALSVGRGGDAGTLATGAGTRGADVLSSDTVPQIFGLAGHDTITAGGAVEQVRGGSDDDTISGAGIVHGGTGDDRINLDGDCGPLLFGGVGRDTIGVTSDTVATGDDGMDTFDILTDRFGSGLGIVTDFVPGQDRVTRVFGPEAAADAAGVTGHYIGAGYLIALGDDQTVLLAGLTPADGDIAVRIRIGGMTAGPAPL